MDRPLTAPDTDLYAILKDGLAKTISRKYNSREKKGEARSIRRFIMWLSTSWLVETKYNSQLTPDIEGPYEIALETDAYGDPVMVKDGIVFLMAMPKHMARPNSVMHFNWYDDNNKKMIEVWEGCRNVGNLYLKDKRVI